MIDIEAMEAKAKAAGPAWVKDGPWAETCVQPAEVLALIRELREARAGLEYVRGYVESLVENGEAVHAVGLLRDIDGFLAEKGESHA